MQGWLRVVAYGMCVVDVVCGGGWAGGRAWWIGGGLVEVVACGLVVVDAYVGVLGKNW